jgi:integrase
MSAVELRRGRANIIAPEDFDHLLHVVQARSLGPVHALRDYAILMFSHKGALRACEIVGLDWRDVIDAAGRMGKPFMNPVTREKEYFFEVPNGIAKKGSGRLIPMHDSLRATLEHLRTALGPDKTQRNHPVIQSIKYWRVPNRISSNALVQYLIGLYESAGLKGSSHSGRRTALTKLAQTANNHGCSLFDVQKFAGHKDIETTECYVEASPFSHQMVRSL